MQPAPRACVAVGSKRVIGGKPVAGGESVTDGKPVAGGKPAVRSKHTACGKSAAGGLATSLSPSSAAPLIYIVEDDAAICGELTEVLEREGFAVIACKRFDHAAEEVLDIHPDLVLLDLTLPGTDGQFICRDVRAVSDVPIIVLTSRTTEIDEVMSMNLGADDFVPKPYRARVLVARIQALLRRSSGERAMGRELPSHGGVQVDPTRSLALANGRQVELTKNELRILSLLISRAGQIVSREDIMRDLWESEAFVDDNTLTVNINRLRATLEKIGVTGYLVTHRGQGYSV